MAMHGQVSSMIKMASGECGGVMNHKWNLTAGCSASSTSTTSTVLKVFRYKINHDYFGN